MACTFEILIPASLPNALDAAQDALDLVDELESQLTVYRENSEVSRLNGLASHGSVPVEERLFELLTLSARLWRETGGAFDITSGALTKCWGFFKGPRRVPPWEELEDARQRVGMAHVRLEQEGRSVRYLKAGLEINLGSIGKGYALDRAAQLLREKWNIPCALLHGGSSSVRALGAPPHDPRGWLVGISDPRDPDYRLGHVRLQDRALGTSAATFQHLVYEGRKLGHIVDPRTGWPAEGLLGACVAAGNAAEADALATAFFILGGDESQSYCATHPEIGAVLSPQAAEGHPLQVVVLGRIEAHLYPAPEPVRS